jgi:hypothetical protein
VAERLSREERSKPTDRSEESTPVGDPPPQLGLREDGKPALITEEELLRGYGALPPWAEEFKQGMELLSRALALQGAYMAVLQRVLVRIAAGQAKLGAAEDVAKAMADGALQLKTESKKLASAGYREVITDFLKRFDGLREELAAQSPEDPS